MLGVNVVRLHRRQLADGTASPGLSCDEEGVFFCSCTPLVLRVRGSTGKITYRERPLAEINFALSAGYGTEVDISGRMGLLKKIAGHLTEGNLSSARIGTLNLRLPEIHNEAALARLKKAEALIAVKLGPVARSHALSSTCSSCRRGAKRQRARKRDVSDEPRIPRGEPGGGRWTISGSVGRPGTSNPNSLLIPAQVAPVMPWVRPVPLPWGLPAPPTEISPFLDLPGDALDPGKPLRNPFPRNERCVEEWDHAFEYCDDLEKKGLLGKGDHKEAGRTYRQCVLGQVSEECGGSNLEA